MKIRWKQYLVGVALVVSSFHLQAVAGEMSPDCALSNPIELGTHDPRRASHDGTGLVVLREPIFDIRPEAIEAAPSMVRFRKEFDGDTSSILTKAMFKPAVEFYEVLGRKGYTGNYSQMGVLGVTFIQPDFDEWIGTCRMYHGNLPIEYLADNKIGEKESVFHSRVILGDIDDDEIWVKMSGTSLVALEMRAKETVCKDHMCWNTGRIIRECLRGARKSSSYAHPGCRIAF